VISAFRTIQWIIKLKKEHRMKIGIAESYGKQIFAISHSRAFMHRHEVFAIVFLPLLYFISSGLEKESPASNAAGQWAGRNAPLSFGWNSRAPSLTPIKAASRNDCPGLKLIVQYSCMKAAAAAPAKRRLIARRVASGTAAFHMIDVKKRYFQPFRRRTQHIPARSKSQAFCQPAPDIY
jgi:hypothetical protein